MDVDVLLARAEGEHAGEVPLVVPFHLLAGPVVEDQDQPVLLLFVREPTPADPRPGRMAHDEVNAPEIVPEVVEQLLQIGNLSFQVNTAFSHDLR